MKKETIRVIIINIILSFIDFFVMSVFALAAFIDDYIEPPTKTQQYLVLSSGVAIAIILDLLINYFITRHTNSKNIKYWKLIIISLIVITLEIIYILTV